MYTFEEKVTVIKRKLIIAQGQANTEQTKIAKARANARVIAFQEVVAILDDNGDG